MAAPLFPTQWTRLATVLTVGVGFTVTVKLVEGPAQPLTLGVTVTVAVTGTLSALAATNAPMLPEPAVPKPTSAELVQSKVVPTTEPPKVMPAAFAPAQCSRLPI